MKGNQKSLYEPVQDLFELSRNPRFNSGLTPHIYRHEIACEHGKIEEREVRALSVRHIADQSNIAIWKGIKSIIETRNINHTDGDIESRYYISSI